MAKRILHQIIGMLLISLGVAIILNTRFGAFPYDANNWFIYQIFNQYLSFDAVMLIVGTILVIINYILTRDVKMFTSIVLVVGNSILIGQFDRLLQVFELHSQLYISIPLTFFGLLILAVGTNFLIVADLLKSPIEDSMLLLNKKFKNLFLSRFTLEILFLIAAVITGLISNKIFEQINIFTVVAVLGISSFIQWTHPFVLLVTRKRKEIKNEDKSIY